MARKLLSLPIGILLFAAVAAGQQDTPVFFRSNCIKLQPGKTLEDYRQYMAITRKLFQSAADDGEISSWGLLRAIAPAGEQAKCDFYAVTTYPKMPAPPLTPEAINARIKKAGVQGLTAAQLAARRDATAKLISGEIWRGTVRVGEIQKGDYVYLNFMKVDNLAAFVEFERTMWKPIAEAWVKNGEMRGWRQSVAFVPSGADVPYRAITADVFPSWEAAFTPRDLRGIFAKVHADKNYEEFIAKMEKVRTLARRALFVVEDRVVPAKQISQR